MRNCDLDKETTEMMPDKPFLTAFPTFAIDSEDMTNNEKIIFIYLMSEVNRRGECELLIKDLERLFKMTTEEIDEAMDRLKRRKLLEYADLQQTSTRARLCFIRSRIKGFMRR